MYGINNSFQKYGVHVAVALFYQLFETEDGGSRTLLTLVTFY